jgi:hypothetical protein
MSLYSNLFFCACVPHTANKSSPIGSGFYSLLIHTLTAACTSCFCYIMTQTSCLTLHMTSSVTWTHFSQLTPPYHILKYLYILSSSITGCTFYSASQSSNSFIQLPSHTVKMQTRSKKLILNSAFLISWREKNGTNKWNKTGNRDRNFGWCMGYLMECASTAGGL